MYLVVLKHPKLKAIPTKQEKIDAMAEKSSAGRDFFLKHEVRIFDSLDAAEKFIAQWQKIDAALPLLKECTTKFKTSILYKRRYMIQTVLGQKNFTERSSWQVMDMMAKVKVGDTFRLYDQTKYILVRLTKKSKFDGGSCGRYFFELSDQIK